MGAHDMSLVDETLPTKPQSFPTMTTAKRVVVVSYYILFHSLFNRFWGDHGHYYNHNHRKINETQDCNQYEGCDL